MGTKLSKKAYQNLINADIEEIEKCMSKHSLAKKHIIEVLKWSIKELYSDKVKVRYPDDY